MNTVICPICQGEAAMEAVSSSGKMLMAQIKCLACKRVAHYAFSLVLVNVRYVEMLNGKRVDIAEWYVPNR